MNLSAIQSTTDCQNGQGGKMDEEEYTWRDYCPCCSSGPGQECDELCKQISKELLDKTALDQTNE